MPRQRSPNRDKAFEIYKEHDGNIELIDIAGILNVPEGTVRGWKNKDKWDAKLNGTFQTNTERSKQKETIAVKEKPLVESVMANSKLTDQQRLFCLHYVKCFNATKAYQKAYSCSYETAGSNGYALLQNTAIRDEINRLKQHRLNQEMLAAEDIFQRYMDIAFSDITDYISFGQEEVAVMGAFGPVILKDPETGESRPVTKTINTIRLHESDQVDGALISEIKQSRDGVSIKLLDKMKALDWIADHMDLATEEQRARIAKLRLDVDRATGGEAANGQLDKLLEAVKAVE